ncbi:hypothetical protein E4U54_007647 [Claviceps lovelessii]|nr:hypothetical protein E4U54_007647 [Claviceps lovelessii]
MRLSWGLALGVALGAQARRLAARQNLPSSSAIPSTTAPAVSSSPSTPIPSTTSPPPSPAPNPGGGGDSTTFITRTITLPDSGSTITSTTTVSISSLVTVTVTTTDIATTTVTRSDRDIATKTVYVTSTQIVNVKRAVVDDEDIFFIGDRPAPVEAEPTPAPPVPAPEADYNELQRFRNNYKRAVVTNFVTVGGGGGGEDKTVTVTATRVVRSTMTTVVHTTSFVTETDQLNAKTTITTTATIIVTMTQVLTGVVETITSAPTGVPAGGGNNNNPNNNNDDNNSGLSDGAKAGIGAGIGVAALLIIGAVVFWLMKRRRNPKPDPDDLLGPSSEVPVGGGGGGGAAARRGPHSSRPMSQGLSSTPGAVPHRNPVLPNVQPEGYRGTAMGAGRAGYAKPETYGASYAPTRSITTNTKTSALSQGDQLPRHPTPDRNSALVSPVTPQPDAAELGNDGAGARWHQNEAAEMSTDNPAAAKWHADNAHEIDSQPVTSHQSGPVYEMSAETYR